jgi:hypothetical protein
MLALLLGLCICTQIDSATNPANVEEVVNSDAYNVCKQVVDAIVQERGYDQRIIERLVPLPFRAMCQLFAEQHINEVFDWINQDLSSSEICNKLLLYIRLEHTSRKAITRKDTRFPADIVGKKVTELTPAQLKSIQCDICNTVVGVVIGMIIKGAGSAAIIAAATAACMTLPPPVDVICVGFADVSIGTIISLVTGGMTNALQVCQHIGVC